MALQTAIPVSFEAFFPRGAFVVGEVEPVVKWSDDGERQGQDLDRISGHPLWQVRVIDADPDGGSDRTDDSAPPSPETPSRGSGLRTAGVLLVVLGGLFVAVTLSVVIQVAFFRATRRRVFRMAPLHHHFEMVGWNEITVVIRFWIIAGICAALGLGLFYGEWVAWL